MVDIIVCLTVLHCIDILLDKERELPTGVNDQDRNNETKKTNTNTNHQRPESPEKDTCALCFLFRLSTVFQLFNDDSSQIHVDSSKLKGFADDNFNCAQNGRSFSNG